jgi:hypothetical protein
MYDQSPAKMVAVIFGPIFSKKNATATPRDMSDLMQRRDIRAEGVSHDRT